jgi:hypothetical protein
MDNNHPELDGSFEYVGYVSLFDWLAQNIKDKQSLRETLEWIKSGGEDIVAANQFSRETLSEYKLIHKEVGTLATRQQPGNPDANAVREVLQNAIDETVKKLDPNGEQIGMFGFGSKTILGALKKDDWVLYESGSGKTKKSFFILQLGNTLDSVIVSEKLRFIHKYTTAYANQKFATPGTRVLLKISNLSSEIIEGIRRFRFNDNVSIIQNGVQINIPQNLNTTGTISVNLEQDFVEIIDQGSGFDPAILFSMVSTKNKPNRQQVEGSRFLEICEGESSSIILSSKNTVLSEEMIPNQVADLYIPSSLISGIRFELGSSIAMTEGRSTWSVSSDTESEMILSLQEYICDTSSDITKSRLLNALHLWLSQLPKSKTVKLQKLNYQLRLEAEKIAIKQVVLPNLREYAQFKSLESHNIIYLHPELCKDYTPEGLIGAEKRGNNNGYQLWTLPIQTRLDEVAEPNTQSQTIRRIIDGKSVQNLGMLPVFKIDNSRPKQIWIDSTVYDKLEALYTQGSHAISDPTASITEYNTLAATLNFALNPINNSYRDVNVKRAEFVEYFESFGQRKNKEDQVKEQKEKAKEVLLACDEDVARVLERYSLSEDMTSIILAEVKRKSEIDATGSMISGVFIKNKVINTHWEGYTYLFEMNNIQIYIYDYTYPDGKKVSRIQIENSDSEYSGPRFKVAELKTASVLFNTIKNLSNTGVSVPSCIKDNLEGILTFASNDNGNIPNIDDLDKNIFGLFCSLMPEVELTTPELADVLEKSERIIARLGLGDSTTLYGIYTINEIYSRRLVVRAKSLTDFVTLQGSGNFERGLDSIVQQNEHFLEITDIEKKHINSAHSRVRSQDSIEFLFGVHSWGNYLERLSSLKNPSIGLFAQLYNGRFVSHDIVFLCDQIYDLTSAVSTRSPHLIGEVTANLLMIFDSLPQYQLDSYTIAIANLLRIHSENIDLFDYLLDILLESKEKFTVATNPFGNYEFKYRVIQYIDTGSNNMLNSFELSLSRFLTTPGAKLLEFDKMGKGVEVVETIETVSDLSIGQLAVLGQSIRNVDILSSNTRVANPDSVAVNRIDSKACTISTSQGTQWETVTREIAIQNTIDAALNSSRSQVIISLEQDLCDGSLINWIDTNNTSLFRVRITDTAGGIRNLLTNFFVPNQSTKDRANDSAGYFGCGAFTINAVADYYEIITSDPESPSNLSWRVRVKVEKTKDKKRVTGIRVIECSSVKTSANQKATQITIYSNPEVPELESMVIERAFLEQTAIELLNPSSKITFRLQDEELKPSGEIAFQDDNVQIVRGVRPGFYNKGIFICDFENETHAPLPGFISRTLAKYPVAINVTAKLEVVRDRNGFTQSGQFDLISRMIPVVCSYWASELFRGKNIRLDGLDENLFVAFRNYHRVTTELLDFKDIHPSNIFSNATDQDRYQAVIRLSNTDWIRYILSSHFQYVDNSNSSNSINQPLISHFRQTGSNGRKVEICIWDLLITLEYLEKLGNVGETEQEILSKSDRLGAVDEYILLKNSQLGKAFNITIETHINMNAHFDEFETPVSQIEIEKYAVAVTLFENIFQMVTSKIQVDSNSNECNPVHRIEWVDKTPGIPDYSPQLRWEGGCQFRLWKFNFEIYIRKCGHGTLFDTHDISNMIDVIVHEAGHLYDESGGGRVITHDEVFDELMKLSFAQIIQMQSTNI